VAGSEQKKKILSQPEKGNFSLEQAKKKYKLLNSKQMVQTQISLLLNSVYQDPELF
jgi:hypothetical protein